MSEFVTPATAEPLTLATIGHPANGCFIVKTPSGSWRYVHSGEIVDSEQFRAGWNIVGGRYRSEGSAS